MMIGEAAPNFWSEVRRLLQLAGPIVMGQLALMTMGVVDMIIAGRLGAEPMAGVALGHVWSFAMVILGLGACMGLDPLIAQAHGAGAADARGRATAHGVGFLTVLAVPITLWHSLGERGLGALGQPVELLGMAGDYAAVLGWSVWPMLMFSLVRQGLQAQGRMTPAMWVLFAGNVVNLAADVVLVWGAGPVPAMGAAGLAWSTTVVRVVMLVALAWWGRDLVEEVFDHRSAVWDGAGIVGVGRVALPVGGQAALEVWAFNASTILVGYWGAEAIAAHTAALNLCALSFMVPMGLGSAVSARVGNLVGAGHDWARSAWAGVALAAGFMCATAAMYTSVPAHLARIYLPSEPAAVALTASLLPIAGAFQVFDGVQVTTFGALRGAGDTQWPALANVLGYWCIGLPVGAWLAHTGGWGPRGIWVGLAIALAVVAGALLFRLQHRVRRGAIDRRTS